MAGEGGFIKLYRGWRDNPVLNTADRAVAWLWLIENACWKPSKFNIKGKSVELQRGQLCASRDHLATVWKWSDSAVERFLTRLKTEQMIERETGHGKTIITICNYAKYQDDNRQAGQESGQESEHKSDRNRTAKEEGKEIKEEKNTHYAFFGRVVRLTERDLHAWRNRYHALADIEAELGALDDWISGQDEKTRKGWFHVASASLNKKHQAAVRKAEDEEDEAMPIC